MTADHPTDHPDHPTYRPTAWLAADADRDTSWIQRLSAAEIASFDTALHHATALDKPLLEMTADDLLDAAARDALARAIDTTQGSWAAPGEGLSRAPPDRGRRPASPTGAWACTWAWPARRTAPATS